MNVCCPIQTQFVVDEVSNIIKESIESTIGGNGYAHSKVGQWTNSVVESCLASLTKLQKPFKYIGEKCENYNISAQLHICRDFGFMWRDCWQCFAHSWLLCLV